MSTTHKTHYDVTLYGVVASLRTPRKAVSELWRVSRRNRILCERHGHDWQAVRADVIAQLRRVEAARKGVAA